MATEKKGKKTFGGTYVAHISPEPGAGVPKVMNIIISFEEALKLHLSLGQALLAKLNSYNRATTAGKLSAVNVSVRPHAKRITVVEGDLPKVKNTKEQGGYWLLGPWVHGLRISLCDSFGSHA